MSWFSSRPIRQSSSSPMQHFLEHQSGHPTQASVSVQGAAAQAKVTLMLGSSWLPSNPPPRHRPPHRQRAQFLWLHWYSSRVRSLASRGQPPSCQRTHARTLLVSFRLGGTPRSQLRRDAKPGCNSLLLFPIECKLLPSDYFFSILQLLSVPWVYCGLCRFISLLPCQSDRSGTIGFIVHTCSRTAVKTPSDLVYAC